MYREHRRANCAIKEYIHVSKSIIFNFLVHFLCHILKVNNFNHLL